MHTYGSRDPDVSQIFSPSVKLKFSSSVGIDWKIIKASTKVDSIEMNDLPAVIQEVNFNLKSWIICRTIAYKIIIINIFICPSVIFQLPSKYSIQLIVIFLFKSIITLFSRPHLTCHSLFFV